MKGKWRYLYRAVDSTGATLDFLLSAKQDAPAAKRFLAKGRPGKTGGYAAFASHVSCIAGYQCDSVERHS